MNRSEVLITGGAGFVGSHIQDRFIQDGMRVAVVDNLRSGKRENLHPNAEFYSVDICDKANLDLVIEKEKPRVIIHAAAQHEVPYSMKNPKEDAEINIGGMMVILESARRHGVMRVIYINTGGALYGELPDDKLPIREDEPIIEPTSFYGVSKLAAEKYLQLFGHLGTPWVSLRLANVYGPRQKAGGEAGIIPTFIERMLRDERPTINGDGGHTRDYVYVEDVVDAVVQAVVHPDSDYFNISTGIEVSNIEIFNTVKTATKSSVEPHFGSDRPGDVRRSSLSNRKAAVSLGWEPSTSFQEGIERTVVYQRNLLHYD